MTDRTERSRGEQEPRNEPAYASLGASALRGESDAFRHNVYTLATIALNDELNRGRRNEDDY